MGWCVRYVWAQKEGDLPALPKLTPRFVPAGATFDVSCARVAGNAGGG